MRAIGCFVMYVALCTAGFAKYEFDPNIAPGTLILTMLVKDEEVHLERSLPEWAKLADYWVIGIDDANTDSSPEVVRRHLGHIPGRLVTIKFDGMGPSWTELVEEGLRSFPQATHGILADADFTPLNSFDKRQLDRRCAKHMFTIQSSDSTLRRMDWVYRNVPGVKVLRRTHQMLKAPEGAGEECPALDDSGKHATQTMLDLVVREYPGGYQDRTPGKQQRYISWLAKDLEEDSEDSQLQGRTLYYLGMAHIDVYLQSGRTNATALQLAVHYLEQRAAIEHSEHSYFEERWFALIKLGELHERFLGDQVQARAWYTEALTVDAERADGWFYLGQNFRLHGLPSEAFGNLYKAVSLELPQRSLFQWIHLYSCMRHLELVRCVDSLLQQQQEFTTKQLTVAADSSAKVNAHCAREQANQLAAASERVQRALAGSRLEDQHPALFS